MYYQKQKRTGKKSDLINKKNLLHVGGFFYLLGRNLKPMKFVKIS